tara:strand:+ start:2575 stop:2829 length:255 start_codon:yes stop_codon:yes gene_type:complete
MDKRKMNKLIRKIRSLFLVNHEGLFPYSPAGFVKAKRWAKVQPHPRAPGNPNLTLWDSVNQGYLSSEYKLHEINKLKTNKDNLI